jgi:hypothetical protein
VTPFPLVAHPDATKTERRKVLTGTDMKRIVNGEWLKVWQEKLGFAEAWDSTYVWIARLGQHTERLHAWWHQHTEKVNAIETPDRPCARDGDQLPHHYAATFDWWVTDDGTPLEMKHRHARLSLREAAEEAMPQLQWQMLIAGVDKLRFSCIFGNAEPEWGWVARDEAYIKRLRQQADVFWGLVETETPPDTDLGDDVELKTMARTIPLNGYRPYDYTRNNEWCAKAGRYIELKPLADECDTIKDELKALVPADAAEVTGAGLKYKRDKKGTLRLTMLETADADAAA